ncbi:MAG TPA: hypothetical protein VJY37_00410 [Anaerovoracaceae bacterium]|nr:hypothetical protein [Anaerovoracaceae bacterium]
MKDLIIIIGTIVLACIIFGFIAGDTGSLRSASKDAMVDSISIFAQ